MIEVKSPDALRIAANIQHQFSTFAVQDLFASFMTEAMDKMEQEVEERTPVLTGTFVGSIESDVYSIPGTVYGELFAEEAIAPDGANTLDYGPVVERHDHMFEDVFELWQSRVAEDFADRVGRQADRI